VGADVGFCFRRHRARAGSRDRHRCGGEVDRDGGAELADRDRHASGDGSRDGEDDAGDPLGQALDQVSVDAGQVGGDGPTDGPVVDRVGQGIAPPGDGQVGFDVDIDLEGLGSRVLLGQHAVGADDPQAAQLDAISVHVRVRL
jgi:hypothetical protein